MREKKMENDKIYLFTTDTCPNCPAAKKFVADNKMDVMQVVVGEGLEERALAEQYGIRSVPTFVVVNGDDYTLKSLEEMMQ